MTHELANVERAIEGPMSGDVARPADFERLLPPLSSCEYAALEDDIRAHGILVPIEVDQHGHVLDGHHRLRAARALGLDDAAVPRRIRTIANDDERTAVILALNLVRRQLSAEQAAEVRERQRELALRLRRQGQTQAAVSTTIGVSESTVSRWEASGQGSNLHVQDASALDRRFRVPLGREGYDAISARLDQGDAVEAVAADLKITPRRVRQIGEIVEARRRRPSAVDTPVFPTGRFRAIVIDPPWPVEKIEREERPRQSRSLDYATMSLEEIEALPVRELADADGCHLYLWTTHRFLPDALRLVEAWGFRYECLLTWVKNVGFTPFSWMYSTEIVVFARTGSLPLVRKGLRQDFATKVTRHSAKPEVFYERVRAASPEPRLEMFARVAQRDGFVVWGAEATPPPKTNTASSTTTLTAVPEASSETSTRASAAPSTASDTERTPVHVP